MSPQPLPAISLRAVSPPADCDILVAPGLLARVGTELRARSKSAKALVVTDSTVAPLHLPALLGSLQAAGFSAISHTLPAGEPHKLLSTLLPAYETFLAANIDRQTPLLALGGGVVGDMAGFLAATLLRGLPFFQVPTTLMAMVDSSIGGKTGVNQPGPDGGKNLIGAFHQPVAVFSDPVLLQTLPPTEIRSGLAECIKHDAIRDPVHFHQLAGLLPLTPASSPDLLARLVHHNAAIKSAVVNEDPFEKGVRAHLNLGHTFAHAIELATRHAVPHGVAVGLGLCAAADLSHRLGLLPRPDADALIATVARAGLPTAGLSADPALMLAAMRKDKKVELGKLRFVLLEAIGQPVIRSDVPEPLVRDVLQHLSRPE